MFNVFKTPEKDKAEMPYLTSSMCEAVNTCPRFGMIHNVMGKRFSTGYRQMALEAGSLMHEVFSLLNLLHLAGKQRLPEHYLYHGKQLFGDRFGSLISGADITDLEGSGTILAIEKLVFDLMSSSDFEDDPNDSKRTLTNLENCAIEFIQYWLANLSDYPIYVEDENNPTSRVGIEISLDAIIENGETGEELRAIGLADAVYYNKETRKVTLAEYKTASVMGDSWYEGFQTRHQLTLYCALLAAYFGKPATRAVVIGSAVPVPRTKAALQHFIVDRDEENTAELFNTFRYTQEIIERYRDDPLKTPMFTHSCTRFFRTCSLIDLCTSTKEDQHAILSEMETEKTLSPSEQKALNKQ